MKKLMLVLFSLFALQTAAMADDDKPIQVSQMPQQAQTFVKKHFANHKVALAKMDSDFFNKSYEVIFTDGNKVEFDKKGNWTEINCKHGVVPAAAIPPSIQKYVNAHYPNTKILKIEREKNGYEVKLSNRLELNFDSKFNLTHIDD